jgi:tRNA threonylcarbamoyl adenosine modification protein YeaZ
VLLLGLDTATPAVTVALHDGRQPLAQLVTVDAHRHAELLAPAIAKVIADAGADRGDLTGVAVGVGPGPYTGLRVGIMTAKVLGEALGIPVYGVCTLDVIAADVEGGEDFLVATDARRREVYWARYDAAGRRATAAAVSAPADIPVQDRALLTVGEGSLLYPSFLPNGRGPTYPAAATVCRVVTDALAARGAAGAAGAGRFTADGGVLLAPEPLYLRRPDAREPGAPKRVSR